MADQNKTRRYFDLYLWLTKAGNEGIARESILDEYQISEKTFSRDLEEIQEIFPFLDIRYERELKRLYCNSQLAAAGDAGSPPNGVHSTAPGSSGLGNVEEKINIFGSAHMDAVKDAFMVHLSDATRLMINNDEFQNLIDALKEQRVLEFYYRQKTKKAMPLFFCYYTERWYLFCLAAPDYTLKKYRLDLVEKVSPLLIGGTELPYSSTEIDALKT